MNNRSDYVRPAAARLRGQRVPLPRILMLVCWLARACVCAANGAAARADGARIGSVRIYPAEHALVVTGWVNQVSGPVELLACGPDGKTHESVFVLAANPLDLQTALLLLDLRPGTPPASLGKGTPQGPALDLWVHWSSGPSNMQARAESFLLNLRTREPLPETPWLFSGSAVDNGKFMALMEESLVATFWDPWAIVNLPLACGARDDLLVVNTNTVPPLQTPVRIRFEVR